MKFSKQGRSDRKQHFEIRFGIPLWIIEPYERVAYQWRKFKFWLNPYKCSCCGKRMYVRNPQYELHFPQGRLMVENLPYKTLICRECLVNELETKEWTPRFTQSTKDRGETRNYNYRFWSTKKCAVTGNKVRSYKDVEIYPYVDMTFCTSSWNHDYISKEAVIKCVREGDIRTSTWGIYDKKKMQPMNHKRLFINEKGELL